MKIVASFIIFTLVCLQYVHAQIPRACTDETSLRDLTCCPSTASDGVCGEDAGRGTCVDLQLPHNTTTTDVRRNWPHYFTSACQCTENFSGYDCSRCKFGYYGDDCSGYQVISRPSVADFSDADWAEYNRILGLAREFDSDYVAVLEETLPGTTTLRTAPLTLYSMFIWLHHYAAKDSQSVEQQVNGVPLDYAHSAPGFNTWHRLHSVWFEWQIQGMLKTMNEPDYHMFRLPWWDWRQESQKTIGLGADDLFVANRGGYSRNVSGRPIVAGDLFDDGWDTICWFTLGQVCDPSVTTGLLQRCPFTGTNPCSTSNPDWPTAADVLLALNISNFDVAPYNFFSLDGYRAFLDFQNGVISMDECREDRQCRCLPRFDPLCTDGSGFTSKSGMHFLGHIILGQGDLNFFFNNNISTIGTIEDVAASPNDPMFILHHNMVDCIFVEWMRRYPDAEYPSNVATTGHARDGFIVPFFPVYTHNNLFVSPEDLGYTCNLFGGAVTTSASVTLVVMLGVLVLSLISYN